MHFDAQRIDRITEPLGQPFAAINLRLLIFPVVLGDHLALVRLKLLQAPVQASQFQLLLLRLRGDDGSRHRFG